MTNYIDGISYNFSILFSDKSLKNAFVAHDKTENQEKINSHSLKSQFLILKIIFA